MKNITKNILIRAFAITTLLLFFSFNSRASHLMGGQITYTWVSGNTYKITGTLYRDCDGVGLGSSMYINISGASSPTSVTLSRIAINDVSILCPGEVSECAGGTTPGIEEHIYQGNVTLPTAALYTFSYSNCCRNGIISTLSPGYMYLSAELNTLLAPGNSSPNFLNRPIGSYCIGFPTSLSPNGADANGDVIVYSLVDARISSASSVSYAAGFSGLNPLTSSTPIVINPNTGEISFSPSAVSTQVAVMAFRAEEFRVIGGVSTKIGEVYRDIQVRLKSCSGNSAPVLSAVPNVIVQVGQAYCVNINATDAATQNITLTAVSSIIPPATFSVTGSGLGFTNSTFCFTPQASDVGNTYTISINAQDDVCDSVATSVRTWNITVPAVCTVSITSSSTNESCTGNDGTATANLIGGTPSYSYSWTGPGGFSSFVGPTITGLVAGTYNVNISDGINCAETATIIVGDNCISSCPPINKAIKPYGMHSFWVNQGASDPNTFYFGLTQWKRLRVIVSGGGGPYTYAWSSNTGTMKNQWGNQVYLFEPTMAPVITCTITDQSNGCVYTETINLGWDTQFYCGNLAATGYNYWMIKVCKGGVTMCVNHTIGKGWMKNGLATLGACGASKTNTIFSSNESYAVYPNPSNGLFSVDYQLNKDADVSVTVTDVMGKVLLNKSLKVGSGYYSDGIDMTNFENGMYILTINIDGETSSKRIQLMR